MKIKNASVSKDRAEDFLSNGGVFSLQTNFGGFDNKCDVFRKFRISSPEVLPNQKKMARELD